ncbi:MAG: ATP phosphoribosyltransferase regulatory subunit [Kiritimatiellia bacterium]|nr:ATP phosphoribosyltransferase regulatory subunit [Kiritimatiellia bacterium]
MSDIGAPEIRLWQELERRAREMFTLYGLEEIRTPLLERQDVFLRALGEATDVVQKEMYTLEDRGGRRLALRPEGTAGVMRHLAGLGEQAADARLYYIGPMFRAERPQAGRRRQFHQVGVELMGPDFAKRWPSGARRSARTANAVLKATPCAFSIAKIRPVERLSGRCPR